MSHANISKFFKDESINSIITLPMDTTLDYIIGGGGSVVWTEDANITFLVKFP